MPTSERVDISENHIYELSPALLDALLKDQTMSTAGKQRNIFWATDDYASLGDGYRYADPIQPHLITSAHGRVVRPRVLKEREQQTARTKERAEVFTPAWLCNRMNNAVDADWFERQDVFNVPQGEHSWKPTTGKIDFPEGKSWQDYVRSIRLEITCGEAPFLVSRYDATSGECIPIAERIGLLDRKLRIVGENVSGEAEWVGWAVTAIKSIYGYEWQGDNLLLARENIFYTFIEYYQKRFSVLPSIDVLMQVAEVVSWNLWQMDGLKGVVPGTCHETVIAIPSLFGDGEEKTYAPCPGCANEDFRLHNGKKCRIMDWAKEKAILFVDTMK